MPIQDFNMSSIQDPTGEVALPSTEQLLQQARTHSKAIAASVGIKIADHLPLLDMIELRQQSAVIDRALCLNAIVHVAHGWKRHLATTWLVGQNLIDRLTVAEREFLDDKKANRRQFFPAVDELWALVWALGIAEKMEFWMPVPDDLVYRLPIVDAGEDCSKFRQRARLRSAGEILKELDLAYCLHWAVRQAQLDHRQLPPSVMDSRIERRRHALEWVAGDSDWDCPNLDT